MHLIVLSNDEKDLLKKHLNSSPLVLVRFKAQAILLRDKKMSVVDIADVLGRSERTVKRWIKNYSLRRLSSIFSGHKNNENASKLTRVQKLEIKKVLALSPSSFGLPLEFWDVPKMKKYVSSWFGVNYESERSYHFLLKFCDLSFKYPDQFRVERNEGLIASRMEEIYEELIPILENPDWEVFASDETRMQLKSDIRRAWLKKGEKTVIKVTNRTEYQNYIGFLSQKTFKFHTFEIDWGKQEEIIKAIQKLVKLYPNKKICIIWDNAACHKGKQLREELKTNNSLQNIHLINLPPYAPDKNPVEHVWQTAKTKLSNRRVEDFQITRNKFMKLTNNQIFQYQI